MKNYTFSIWCHAATARIRFGPDRKKVHEELMQHLEDRKEAFLEQGMSDEEATRHTIEAMGNAQEIAPQLGQIHSPFWGYFLRVCKIILVAILCLSFLPVWRYCKNLDLKEPSVTDFPLYEASSYGGSTGRTLHHLSQPDISCKSDGITYTITDAVVYTVDATGETRLYMRVTRFSWMPVTEYTQYLSMPSLIPFSLRDNEGQVYTGYHEIFNNNHREGPYLNARGAQSGIFTYTYDCYVRFFSPNITWVELFYDFDGRKISMRVNLTGGIR